jgi:hypothetical protein
MPELVTAPTNRFKLPAEQHYTTLPNLIPLHKVTAKYPFRVIEGMGAEWTVLQLGEPMDDVQNPESLSSQHINLDFETAADADSVSICISCVPVWPVSRDRSNRFGVSVDGSKPIVCENKFQEWSASWKRQVLENRRDFTIVFPLDKKRRNHTVSLIIGDPGQLIQRISFQEK